MMGKKEKFVSITIVIFAILFVFYNLNYYWSGSVDVSHHYILAYRINQILSTHTNGDITLGEMDIYPRGAHILSAFWGRVFGSVFLGMHVVSVLSVFGVWASIILILRTLPDFVGRISAVLLVVFLAMNAHFSWFEVHGNEIVGNYFLSQLVSQFVLFAAILFSVRVEKNKGNLAAIFVVFAAMLLAATIHLLPAVEMLGLGGGLLGCYVLFGKGGQIRALLWRFVIAAAVLCMGLAALIQLPAFNAMRKIADNNGALGFAHISYPVGVVCLFVLSSTVSVFLFVCWVRSEDRVANVAMKYFSIYGASASALCAVQFVLLHYGVASEYAVKKYCFGLISIIVVSCAILVSRFLVSLSRFWFSFLPKSPSGMSDFGGVILAGCLLVVTGSALPHAGPYSVPAVVAAERQIIAVNDLLLPLPSTGKHDLVVGLAGVHGTIDYMLSAAVLKTPRDLAHVVIDPADLRSKEATLDLYDHIITTVSPASGVGGACSSITTGALAIYEAACFEQARKQIRDCHQPLDFSDKSFIPATMADGFSVPEGTGRWTEGHKAHLRCANSGAVLEKVTLTMEPFLYLGVKRQRFLVSLNGVKLGSYDYVAGNAVQPLVIEIPSQLAAPIYDFEFDIPDAQSPAELSPGGAIGDSRVLGFFFNRAVFQ